MKKLKSKLFALGTVGATALSTMAVYAVDTKSIIGRVVGLITSIAMYIGIVLLAWGIVQLVLAFKNEDADSKSRAIMLIVVSVALIGLKPILTAILNGTGVTPTDVNI